MGGSWHEELGQGPHCRLPDPTLDDRLREMWAPDSKSRTEGRTAGCPGNSTTDVGFRAAQRSIAHRHSETLSGKASMKTSCVSPAAVTIFQTSESRTALDFASRDGALRRWPTPPRYPGGQP